ncbi:predicted protein [Plenodomus lingam JN3]|uniref:Predicted protein n=1 Tax=Leptosphaeria maculans (strain JN3 / isolate v23.1.3 / race Av1-4-5-6-7-8) TaxID=985895 RepID=E4ZUW7_LEPMJ|nr:predicted protein [Plenodomus lingam JN3]CBX94904.1 predicted protein [Plenodomus lingam JN3]
MCFVPDRVPQCHTRSRRRYFFGSVAGSENKATPNKQQCDLSLCRMLAAEFASFDWSPWDEHCDLGGLPYSQQYFATGTRIIAIVVSEVGPNIPLFAVSDLLFPGHSASSILYDESSTEHSATDTA